MSEEVQFTATLTISTGNEISDEALIQAFFLTASGGSARVETDFKSASMPSLTSGTFETLPGELASNQFPVTLTAPTPPTDDEPYLAVVIRAVEQDNSSDRERAVDINRVSSRLLSLPVRPLSGTIIAAVSSIVPDQSGVDDDDDLVGSTAIVVSDPQGLRDNGRAFSNFALTGSTARYVFTSVRLGVLEPRRPRIERLSSAASGVDSDTAARAFIRQTPVGDLALLTPLAANNLLEPLFVGHTGGEDERAIVDLVAALPSATVRTLASTHGRTAEAYDDEVDGSAWDELKPILARSIAV